ncbi:uncharacterized protein LOC129588688 [Paramacrobiotus metropolitanus]|uniref:uncharacterized protein LOC129588688 n=1 Tax=Paramacrobiotus metropolitanus TaxID=2943436 RepID=UPI0024461F27|nr:uncharacterized protein LOC129588688 [Paramacrobiotus metropolitanus]XP_055339007.1 uncharacterized protein LOC129588688 [Paramacrobiotus metropolitanus]XP_055339008.1 uncharacterized protein LOC129588688 [Paramacrobiotus metropolitanus]
MEADVAALVCWAGSVWLCIWAVFWRNGKRFWPSTCCERFLGRSKRINLELDHALLIRFSPDNKAVIGRMHNADEVCVFKLTTNANGQRNKLCTTLPIRRHTPTARSAAWTSSATASSS